MEKPVDPRATIALLSINCSICLNPMRTLKLSKVGVKIQTGGKAKAVIRSLKAVIPNQIKGKIAMALARESTT
jgi:hypothetical protein